MRSSPAQVSAYLPLRYVLTDTVAVRTRQDPLHVDTELTVPGRAQRGMLAAALRRAGREEALHEWVARGHRLRFAPAHPRLEPGETVDGGAHPEPGTARVAYPAPANLYTPGKDGTTLVDAFGPTDPSVPYKAVREPMTLDRVLRARVGTTAERFLARPGPRGPGGPFHTTALEPGQVFEARWQLRGPDEQALESLAEDVLDTLAGAGGTLTLGSGGTRAHGGVHVEPAEDGHPLSPDRARCPWPERSVPAGGTVDLLLLSPALVVGETGAASPRSLVAEAARLCRRYLPDADIEVVTGHVESVLVGAYHRGYHGPMAQRWAAAPGAVVRLSTRTGLTTAQLRSLEAHHLGERPVDGYGQFTLVPPPPHGPPALPPVAVPVARVPDRPDPEQEEWGTELVGLHGALLWEAAAPVVRAHARARARDCEHRLAPLTAGLLEQLAEILTGPGHTPRGALAALARAVSGADGALPPRALSALERARPTAGGRTGPVTARDWLSLPFSEPETLAAWWLEHRPAPGSDPDYAAALAAVDLDLTEGRPPAPGELSPRARHWQYRESARLARAHLAAWLGEAARLLRTRGGARP